MRKFTVAMVTIMIVMVMGISSLFGCGLVTTNNARDLSQVVATVQISEDAPKDVIYKRDLITAYMNNYQYQGAELTQDTLDGILSSLINNRVLIQFALKEMDNSYSKPSDWEDLLKYNEYLENFLSDQEELDAKYSTYKAVDDLVDSYAEEDDEEKRQDTFDGTARVVPTGATNDDEVTNEEKQEFIDNFSVADRMTAFIDAINALKDNDLLGDEYDNNDITKTDYFKKTLKSNLEQQGMQVVSMEEKTLSNKYLVFNANTGGINCLILMTEIKSGKTLLIMVTDSKGGSANTDWLNDIDEVLSNVEISNRENNIEFDYSILDIFNNSLIDSNKPVEEDTNDDNSNVDNPLVDVIIP